MDEKYLRWASLLMDDYNQRILAAAMGEPITTQELAPITGIPIAVAYRRINALADAGLLRPFETYAKTPAHSKKGILVMAYKSILGRFDMAIDFGRQPPMARLEFLLLGGNKPFFLEVDLKMLRKPKQPAEQPEQVVHAGLPDAGSLDGRLPLG